GVNSSSSSRSSIGGGGGGGFGMRRGVGDDVGAAKVASRSSSTPISTSEPGLPEDLAAGAGSGLAAGVAGAGLPGTVGIVRILWQPGQRILLPPNASLACSFLPQVQPKGIDMGNLPLFPSLASPCRCPRGCGGLWRRIRALGVIRVRL